jgi:uncharacterized damage-inducible protein DinB
MLGPTYLEDNFRTVRRNTVVIAEEIPADKYAFSAAAGVKSVGEMLAHLAVAPRWQMALHSGGASFVDADLLRARSAQLKNHEQELRTKEQIVAALQEEGERVAAFLRALTPQTLQEIVTFAPPIEPSAKSRFEMLLSLKEHEMHHRAQLMLIQRMLGIVPHLTRRREAFAAGVRS